MKHIFFFLITILIFSCSNNEKSEETTNDTTQVERSNKKEIDLTMNPLEREVKTSSGKTVVVKESHPKGQSLSDISVQFKDDSATILSLFDKDPISDVLVGDLDKNGFDEIYVITTAAGSGSYGTVHGFNSNKDKSFSMIYLPENDEKDIKDGILKGYTGHDIYKIEGQSLVRTFAVSADKKETKSISYLLSKTETGYALSIKK